MAQRRFIAVQTLSTPALSARLNTLRMWRSEAYNRLGEAGSAPLLEAIHRLDDQIASTRRAIRRRGG